MAATEIRTTVLTWGTTLRIEDSLEGTQILQFSGSAEALAKRLKQPDPSLKNISVLLREVSNYSDEIDNPDPFITLLSTFNNQVKKQGDEFFIALHPKRIAKLAEIFSLLHFTNHGSNRSKLLLYNTALTSFRDNLYNHLIKNLPHSKLSPANLTLKQLNRLMKFFHRIGLEAAFDASGEPTIYGKNLLKIFKPLKIWTQRELLSKNPNFTQLVSILETYILIPVDHLSNTHFGKTALFLANRITSLMLDHYNTKLASDVSTLILELFQPKALKGSIFSNLALIEVLNDEENEDYQLLKERTEHLRKLCFDEFVARNDILHPTTDASLRELQELIIIPIHTFDFTDVSSDDDAEPDASVDACDPFAMPADSDASPKPANNVDTKNSLAMPDAVDTKDFSGSLDFSGQYDYSGQYDSSLASISTAGEKEISHAITESVNNILFIEKDPMTEEPPLLP